MAIMGLDTALRFYTDIESLFEMQVPSDWLADTSGQMGTRVAFVSPVVDCGFQANVNVVVSHLSPLTRDEFLTFSRLQLKQLSGETSLPVDKDCDDPPGAHVFEWINNQAPIPLTVRQQVVFSMQKAFVISATDLSSNFNIHRQTFVNIFRSFRLKDSG